MRVLCSSISFLMQQSHSHHVFCAIGQLITIIACYFLAVIITVFVGLNYTQQQSPAPSVLQQQPVDKSGWQVRSYSGSWKHVLFQCRGFGSGGENQRAGPRKKQSNSERRGNLLRSKDTVVAENKERWQPARCCHAANNRVLASSP